MHARTAVGLTAGRKDAMNVRGELLVLLHSRTRRPFAPGRIAAAGQPEHVAQHRDRLRARVGSHELVLLRHCGIREKMSMTFFRISRSMLTIS